MKVEIILNDNEDQPVLKLTNCGQPKILDQFDDNAIVYIEDLKLALRKLVAK